MRALLATVALLVFLPSAEAQVCGGSGLTACQGFASQGFTGNQGFVNHGVNRQFNGNIGVSSGVAVRRQVVVVRPRVRRVGPIRRFLGRFR